MGSQVFTAVYELSYYHITFSIDRLVTHMAALAAVIETEANPV
jgi:hypothetical protein